jgi:hypothetical protein
MCTYQHVRSGLYAILKKQREVWFVMKDIPTHVIYPSQVLLSKLMVEPFVHFFDFEAK